MQHLAEAYTDIALREAPAEALTTFRKPTLADGPAVNSLIARCPPLDQNSPYCNLLQCSHFSETCVVAERNGGITGWISGFLVPGNERDLFIWQVAVDPTARGEGLGTSMILEILERPFCGGVTRVVTSITDSNVASWRTFSRLSNKLNATMNERPWMRSETHLMGRQPTEHEVVIGPFNALNKRRLKPHS